MSQNIIFCYWNIQKYRVAHKYYKVYSRCTNPLAKGVLNMGSRVYSCRRGLESSEIWITLVSSKPSPNNLVDILK